MFSSAQQASIQTIVVGSKQLTAAQSQYFSQLTARSDENRMQQAQQQTPSPQVTQKTPPQVQPGQSSVIYNSSISSSPQQAFSTAVTQPSFSAVSQSYGSVTPSQAFTAMVSSQTFQQSPTSSYQSPSSISGSASYSRAACKDVLFIFVYLT